MATFTPYDAFIQELGRGGHDLDADVLKIALSNTAPTVASDATLSDVTEISAGGGYSAGGETVANNAYSQTSGTGILTGDDVTFTASGSVASFRYAIMYNSSKTDKLIGYLDHGSTVTMVAGDSYTVNADPSNGYLQVT